MADDTPQAIAYEHAKTSIERQVAALADVRRHAATLLAASAVVASLLGRVAIESPEPEWALWVAALGFWGVLVSALGILWPWPFIFGLDAVTILKDHAGNPGTPVPRLQAFLARSSRDTTRRMRSAFCG